MSNFDYITKENIKEHNPNWPEIPDHPYRMLIAGASGSEKTDSLLNLINHEADTINFFLYERDPYEAKYKLLIRQKSLNYSKAFIVYSNDMDDIYKILTNTIQIKNKKHLLYWMI